MRLRKLLLASTAIGFLVPFPALAQAPDTLRQAYRSYLTAQQAGDPAGLESAQAALTSECVAAGYPGLDECVEALSAQFQADLNTAVADYQSALNDAGSGDYAGAQMAATAASARIQQLCTDQGYPSIEACIGQSLPPLPQPAAAEPPVAESPAAEAAPAEPSSTVAPAADTSTEPAPSETPPPVESAPSSAETPVSPSADPQAQFQTDLNTAVGEYQAALNQAGAGDYAGAQTAADAAAARIQQLCTDQGFASIEACIGQSLPPLPQPPATEAPAQAPAAEPPAGETPSAETPPEEAPAQSAPTDAPPEAEAPPAEPPPTEPASPGVDGPAAPDTDAQATFQSDLNTAISAYQAALDQAGAGDYAGAQTAADAAAARIQQLCTDQGFASIEACIGQSLPPLPQPPATEAPAQAPAAVPPAAETPSAETPPAEAPAQSAPTDAPPEAEAPPAEPPPTEPASPGVDGPAAPDTDAQATFQSDLNTAISAYQAALDQAGAGDYAGAQTAADAAAARIQQLCTDQGFASIEACIGQSLPPLPQPPATEAPAQAPAAVPPAAETPPAETPAPQAPAEPAPSDTPAAAEAPTEPAPPTAEPTSPSTDGPAAPDTDAHAQFQNDLNAAIGAYQAALDQADAGDYAGAQPTAAAAAARIQQLCTDQGYASIEDCIGQSLPPLPPPANVAEPPVADSPATGAPATEPPAAQTPVAAPPASEAVPAETSGGTNTPPAEQPPTEAAAPVQATEGLPPELADDPLAIAESNLQAGAQLYAQGVTRLAQGDAGGQADVDAATQRLQENCGPLGYASIEECVAAYGIALSPIPDAPMTAPSVTEQTPPVAEQPASPPAITSEDIEPGDPRANAEAQLFAALEIYDRGVAALDAGDTAGQADVDAATATMRQSCEPLGYTSLEECLASYGVTLSPLPGAAPAAPSTAELPAQQPLSGEDEAVTPAAVEPLPAFVAPQEAAPLLDSQKQAPRQAVAAPAHPAPPAAPPPASDAQAQAALPRLAAPVSVTAEPGQQIAAGPVAFAPPQNVTIINQTTINNSVNTTNVTTNNVSNTTITQNTQNNTVNNNQTSINIDNSTNVDNSTNLDVTVNSNSSTGGFMNRPAGTPTLRPPRSTPTLQPPVASQAPRAPRSASTGFVFQLGAQIVISNPEQERNRIYRPAEDEIYYETLSGDRIRETIQRPNGVKIVTIRNRQGDILRRSRFSPDGREYVLIYGSTFETRITAEWEDPGEDLPPLRLNIPARDYIFDADRADEAEIEVFFSQPPVERVRRIYTLEEVKHSARIRDTVRRLEIGDLTFDTGKATVPRDQIGALRNVAKAMLDLLAKNPAETFLIEGHADAVGSEVSNLELSDRRAATVAQILTEFYKVPPENLTTQGYGEAYLKVRTEQAERLNRRVAVRRITPLVTLAEQ